MLIVITGPVGGGKSSTAVALAKALRQSERNAVAVIDLDLVFGFVRQTDFGDEVAWNRARVGAAALANALFRSGMSHVIVDGEFFTPRELDALVSSIPANISRRVFTLKVSYPQAWQRVQGDSSRGRSRDPLFLQAMLVKFDRALPFLTQASVVIDADEPRLVDVVDQLVAMVAGADT